MVRKGVHLGLVGAPRSPRWSLLSGYMETCCAVWCKEGRACNCVRQPIPAPREGPPSWSSLLAPDAFTLTLPAWLFGSYSTGVSEASMKVTLRCHSVGVEPKMKRDQS